MSLHKGNPPLPLKRPKKRSAALRSALAHASFATAFPLGPFSMAIPLALWLTERRRSKPMPSIAFHAKQAFFYQLFVYAAVLLVAAVTRLLVVFLIGLLMIPFVILAFLGAVSYAVYGGVQVWNGKRFKYKYLTDLLERRTPK